MDHAQFKSVEHMLRSEALDQAIKSRKQDDTAEKTVESANKFFDFLVGAASKMSE